MTLVYKGGRRSFVYIHTASSKGFVVDYTRLLVTQPQSVMIALVLPLVSFRVIRVPHTKQQVNAILIIVSNTYGGGIRTQRLRALFRPALHRTPPSLLVDEKHEATIALSRASLPTALAWTLRHQTGPPSPSTAFPGRSTVIR